MILAGERLSAEYPNSSNKINSSVWGSRRNILNTPDWLFIYQVAKRTAIPEKVVEGIELGRYVKYGKIRRLAEFYGKKVHIILD